MNATVATPSLPASGPMSRLSAGLGNLVAKDVRDWLRTRRAPATLVTMTALGTLATLTAWIAVSTGRHLGPGALDPTTSVLGGGWSGTIPLVVVFATMGLMTAERERGTLGWSLANPVARPAFVASKFVTATIALVLLAVAIPLAIASVAATMAYGGAPDLGEVVRWGVALVPLVVFFVAVTVVLGTFLPSQGPVAALAIVLTLLPRFLEVINKDVIQYLPTSMDSWVFGALHGASEPAATPIIWAVSVLVLLGAAMVRLERAEI